MHSSLSGQGYVQPGSMPHPALARCSEAFGVRLFSSLRQRGMEENVFIAPYSVYVALGMLTAGATDETLKELVTAMHAGELVRGADDTGLHTAVRGSLESAMAAGFKPANSVWVAKEGTLQPGFSAVLEGSYDACARGVDFKHNADGARREINEWVAAKTEQRIKDVLPPGSVTKQIYMVLCNAIYFKEKWAQKFEIEQRLTDFHLPGNKGTKKVTYIRTKQSLRYFYDKKMDADIVFVPYEKAGAAAVVIVPRGRGLSTTQLGDDTISAAFIQAGNPQKVELTLPKFKVEVKEELTASLQLMGLVRMFDIYRAQFGRVMSAKPLKVSGVHHAVFVAVDEVGTEAAAATAITMVCIPISCTIEPEPVRVVADRPFFFGLVNVLPDGRTVNTVFIGAVNNPLADPKKDPKKTLSRHCLVA